jgi:predicted dehydrogenase
MSLTAKRPTSKPLRVVIIGAGMIGEVHRRASLLSGAQLVGVFSSRRESTLDAAEQWNTEPLDSLTHLAKVEPDVVHVCTPNALHAEHVEAAIVAGAHVICEKPLSVSTEAAQGLTNLATAHKRVATVPFVYRFHPLVREIRARAQAGEFGRWQLLHGSYLQDWLLSPMSTSWRVDSKLGGPSRAFADIGSHWCDLMEFVSGERIASLSASMSITVPERPIKSTATFSSASASDEKAKVYTEDAATVLFKTTSGVLGSVVISQVSAGRKNRLWIELDGAQRSAVFDQENPETLWLGSEASAEILQRDPSRGSPEQKRLSHLPAGHPQGYAQCFENFVADTYASIQGEMREGLPTFTDGLRSAHIIDAVIRSATTGVWVNVPSSEN